MAPNSLTNTKSKKAYNRMVQPALPLLPGLKSRAAKTVAVEPEPEPVDSEPAPQVDSAITPAETVPAVEESGPGALQDGSPGLEETSALAEEVPSPTPPQSSITTDEPARQVQNSNGESREEMDNNLGSEDQEFDIGTGDVVEAANNSGPDSTAMSPATETDRGQGSDGSVNGHLPQATEVATPTPHVDSEEQEEPAASDTLSLDLAQPTTAPAYLNGIGSPHSIPAENGGYALQPEQINEPENEAPQAVSGEDALRGLMVNGNLPPSTTAFALPATVPRTFNALPSLAEHLLLLNATKEGVDILIQVNPSNTQPFASYSHSVILLRSLRLRRLITRQQQANNSYGSNVITLYPARYVMPHAFEAALRFFYSDTVLGKDFFVQPHAGADYQTVRVHNLDYLMSYWVSGIELGLEPVSICAERLLNSYLDWDILEITYKYAVELANSPIISHGKNMTGSDYLVASSSIIKLILQFLANHIDIKNFKLETASTHHLIPTRLPQLEDGRPKHNLALAGMVFGSMPSSADMSPSSPQSEILPAAFTFKDLVASNILLNVDFENLFAFNNFIQAPTIGDPATRKLMVDVVNERESRRQKIHSSRVPNKERMANSAAWESVGIKELILDTNVLHRDRVGFLASSSK